MVVKRSHTAENVAPAIVTLKNQINEMYPNRAKDSDGIWPSSAHTAANPNSDHEAGNGLDITDNLGDGKHIDEVIANIIASGDDRVHYIIHNGRIWHEGRGWQTYNGSNSHSGHMHLSVYENKRWGKEEWDIAGKARKVTPYRVQAVRDFSARWGYRKPLIWKTRKNVKKGTILIVTSARGTMRGIRNVGWTDVKNLKRL